MSSKWCSVHGYACNGGDHCNCEGARTGLAMRGFAPRTIQTPTSAQTPVAVMDAGMKRIIASVSIDKNGDGSKNVPIPPSPRKVPSDADLSYLKRIYIQDGDGVITLVQSGTVEQGPHDAFGRHVSQSSVDFWDNFYCSQTFGNKRELLPIVPGMSWYIQLKSTPLSTKTLIVEYTSGKPAYPNLDSLIKAKYDDFLKHGGGDPAKIRWPGDK